MSSRAHRPAADEEPAGFGQPELVASEGDDSGAESAQARESGVAAAALDAAPETTPAPIAQAAGDGGSPPGAAGGDASAPGGGGPATGAAAAQAGSAALDEAPPTVRQSVAPDEASVEAPLMTAESASPDAEPLAAAPGDDAPEVETASAEPQVEADDLEVQSSDLEPDEAPASEEADPAEMTAAELGLAVTRPRTGEATGDVTEGAAPFPLQGPQTSALAAASRAEADDRSEHGSSPQGTSARASSAPPTSGKGAFDAPWVDEVPDAVTPYEQRVSETVRIADLPAAEQLRGRLLANRYLAEDIIEQRPSGITYRAYHLALDRSVLVRVLPRGLACSEEAAREVRRMAAVAAGLAHPNIGATLDFGVLADGWPYWVTEQLQGQTLAALISQEGKFLLRRVLHVGRHLSAALSAAHEAGLVHGLLSPDTVFVVEPGSPAEVAVLLGFGVSAARGSIPGPPRSNVFGVPFYVSPEQASCRELDARSDIYSLGILLYELMAGSPPFSDGDFAGVLCQHLDDEPPAPSSRLRSAGALAKAMDAVIQRCLRKEPSRRYQTAKELEDDLLRLEEAALRNKRRPMPEVKRPTTTIHSPPPKAEGNVTPAAKVIVHGNASEVGGEEPGSDPGAAREPITDPGSHGAPGVPPDAGTVAPLQSSVSGMRPAVARPSRVSVNQATIKISAVDRVRLMSQRPSGIAVVGADAAAHKSWVNGVLVALKRFFAKASGGE